MLTRPLPPFRVRPLHKVTSMRTITLEQIREMAESDPQTIKAPRRSMKLEKPGAEQRLRVLGRDGKDKS